MKRVKATGIPPSFSVVVLYNPDCRIQKRTLRLLHLRAKREKPDIDVVVLYRGELADESLRTKYHRFKFWRTEAPVDSQGGYLLYESMKVSRHDVVLVLMAHVLPSRNDLYNLANKVREDTLFSWVPTLQMQSRMKRRVAHYLRFTRFLVRSFYHFQRGNFFLYDVLSEFYLSHSLAFFGFEKRKMETLLKMASSREKGFFYEEHSPTGGFRNYNLFYMAQRFGFNLENINSDGRSVVGIDDSWGIWFSFRYLITMIRRVIGARRDIYHIHLIRFLFPIGQLAGFLSLFLLFKSISWFIAIFTFYFLISFPVINAILKYHPRYFFWLPIWIWAWLLS